MSWERSKTTDVLWGARKLILTAASAIEVRMDQIDPTGEERYADDEGDGESTLGFLFTIDGMLRRANSALHEVEGRMVRGEVSADAEAHAAAMPVAQ